MKSRSSPPCDRLPTYNSGKHLVWYGLGASVCSAVLLILAFPTYSLSFLAWVGLVPLILVCWQARAKTAWLYGFVFGFVLAHGVFQWMYHLPNIKVYHCILLASFVALYPAVWCALISFAKGPSISVLIIVPSCWVLLQYLKSHAGFLSMPWAALAHSQEGALPVIQLAEFTGEYGVTFLVVFVNTAVAQYIETRKLDNLVFSGIVFLSVICLGCWSLLQTDKGQMLNVAAVQPARPPRFSHTGAGNLENLESLESLSVLAAKSNPDLILWPESLLTKWHNNAGLISRVTNISAKTGVPLVIGVTGIFKFHKQESANLNSIETKQQNSAFLVDPGGEILGPYNKHILVPFAEYTPLKGKVEWPEWLFQKSAGLTPGDRRVAFKLKDEIVAVPIICWENLFPDFVRQTITNHKSVILQLVNDSDFGMSSASTQHTSASVFRAVENRVPVIISSNTGPSMIIDSKGKVLAKVEHLFEKGTAIGEVVPGRKQTFYNKYGDVFVLFLSFLVLVYLCMLLLKKKRLDMGQN